MSSIKTIQQKLWDKTSPEPNTGCLLFHGVINSRYGMIKMPGHKVISAHRLAWIDTYGEIPEGLGVLHKCDTPICVNPRHLFLGTHKQNMEDKVKKGRLVLWNKNKTHCKYGHIFDETNTDLRYSKKYNTMQRRCKRCAVLDRIKRRGELHSVPEKCDKVK